MCLQHYHWNEIQAEAEALCIFIYFISAIDDVAKFYFNYRV